MITTTWGPDTCECRVTYSVDETNESAPLVYVSTQSTCALHVGLAGPTLLAVLLAENQSKNKMAYEILQRVPRLGVIEESGAATWAPGVQFLWSFLGSGNNRQLRVEVLADPPLTQQEKGQIKAATAGMSVTVDVV